MISIQNLVRKYGDLAAVADVTTNIDRGEIVGLLGHNGAGKTTLMKTLTGYLDPTSGSVTVDGLDVVAQRKVVQAKIGYLPENAPLYPEMLVQEYLLMMAELRGLEGTGREEAVRDAVRKTGLVEYLIHPISNLSKGFRQRVGIAQAILHKPDVLVLDEPTNGLDPLQIQSIRELILDLGKTTTIILSTHILQEIEAVCDRVLVMMGGRLVADAPLGELMGSTALQLSVKAGDDVVGTLKGLEGIKSVTKAGEDAGFIQYTLMPGDESDPSPVILKTGIDAGWTIQSLAPKTRTLEQVFKELQQREVARQKQEVAA